MEIGQALVAPDVIFEEDGVSRRALQWKRSGKFRDSNGHSEFVEIKRDEEAGSERQGARELGVY
jgi:hypothetical protein